MAFQTEEDERAEVKARKPHITVGRLQDFSSRMKRIPLKMRLLNEERCFKDMRLEARWPFGRLSVVQGREGGQLH